MNKTNWNYPTTVWIGENRVKDLSTACKDLGIKKPLLVTDKGLSNSSIVKDALSDLKNKDLNIELFSDVIGNTKVFGLQYHPEITYEKMISLIEFRKDKLIETRKVFKNEDEIEKHIISIKNEIAVSNKAQRMIELKNWLDTIPFNLN